MDNLRDIKPIIEVVDYSFYYFLAIVFIIILIIIFGLYKYFTRIKKTKKPTQQEMALQRLKKLDFNDTKNVAYRFSIDGFLFVNEENKDKFQDIEKRLQKYKYKKDVDNLSSELKVEIKDFIKGLK